MTRRPLSLAVGAIALTTLLAGACGDGTGPGSVPPPRGVSGIDIIAPGGWIGGPASVAEGRTITLVARVYDSAGAVIPDAQVTWRSWDTTVATVDASGVVTGVRPSDQAVAVTAHAGGKESGASVHVLVPATSITIRTPTSTVVPEAAFTVGLTLHAASGDSIGSFGRPMQWTTSNSGVATVDAHGKVVAIGPGEATITGTLTEEGVAGSAQVTVGTLRYRTVQYAGNMRDYARTACALTEQGVPYCWGRDIPGQLFTKDYVPYASGAPVPTALETDVRFEALSVGASHMCALTAAGEAYCWGSNDAGQLGDGTIVTRWTPAPVSGGLTFTRIAAGNGRTCGLTQDGSAYCWGSNDRGAFGHTGPGTTTPAAAVPGLRLSELSRSTGAASASGAQCGRTTDGGVYCWGGNDHGAVGNGSRSPATEPVPPSPIASDVPLATVSAGGEHACGLSADGTAYCWGNGWEGALARTLEYPLIDSVPRPIDSPLRFTRIATGLARSCGVTAEGEAYCWGQGWGNAPRRVATPEPLAEVHVTAETICGSTVSKVFYCFAADGGPVARVRGQ
jgi:hypothetical protein